MASKSTITLSEAEQKIVTWVAKCRYQCARQNGIKNARIGGQSNEFTDLNGFGGEMAFCRLLNIYPDFSIYPRKGGFDCKIDDQKTDVKTTKYASGRLLVRNHKTEDTVEIYALMVGEFPTYWFAGWISSEQLFNRKPDPNFKNSYVAEQYELDKEIESLKNLKNFNSTRQTTGYNDQEAS